MEEQEIDTQIQFGDIVNERSDNLCVRRCSSCLMHGMCFPLVCGHFCCLCCLSDALTVQVSRRIIRIPCPESCFITCVGVPHELLKSEIYGDLLPTSRFRKGVRKIWHNKTKLITCVVIGVGVYKARQRVNAWIDENPILVEYGLTVLKNAPTVLKKAYDGFTDLKKAPTSLKKA